MNDSKYLAIAILVGGKSARFDFEKGVLELFEKPLILHQIETLAKFDEDVFLVAHSEEQIDYYYRKIDFPKEINFIVDDAELFPYPEIRTPLLGVYSALKELNNLNFQQVFILSCDMPLIRSNVVNFIIKQVEGYECCIPRWDNGFLEPLFSIYPVVKAYQKAKEIIKKKQYSLTKLIDESWNTNYVSVEKLIKPLDEELLTFININGPIDIEKLLRTYKLN